MLKPIAAALFALGLLVWPETALNAAREAMATWALSVAPALFPFMALMPMLTAAECARAYEFLLGRPLRSIFGLPGRAAPALVAGMTAGSPAGALAAARIQGLSRADRERIVCCACGLSPAFLVTGIGASMLHSAAWGRILLRSQIAAQLTLLLLTRASRIDETPPPAPVQDSNPTLAILNVCGKMMLFTTAAALITRLTRSETVGLAILTLLDLPSGARAISTLPLPDAAKLLLISAATGFGGLCIAAQNLSACPGVRATRYFSMRAAAAALMTAATALQLRWNPMISEKILPPIPISALISTLLILPAVIFWNKNPFLNMENPQKKARPVLEKSEKPQDVAIKMEEKSNILRWNGISK